MSKEQDATGEFMRTLLEARDRVINLRIRLNNGGKATTDDILLLMDISGLLENLRNGLAGSVAGSGTLPPSRDN